MTIIVFDEGTFYTDSLCTAGDSVISDSTTKVEVFKTERYGILMVAYAGVFVGCYELIKQLKLDQDIETKPENSAIQALAINQAGDILEYYCGSTELHKPILTDGRWFGGCGQEQARAIMSHGETDPVKTIATVKDVNIACGGDTVGYRFKSGEHGKYEKRIFSGEVSAINYRSECVVI